MAQSSSFYTSKHVGKRRSLLDPEANEIVPNFSGYVYRICQEDGIDHRGEIEHNRDIGLKPCRGDGIVLRMVSNLRYLRFESAGLNLVSMKCFGTPFSAGDFLRNAFAAASCFK